eukprot:363024-Chlamydomonas_euryale.AAC.2
MGVRQALRRTTLVWLASRLWRPAMVWKDHHRVASHLCDRSGAATGRSRNCSVTVHPRWTVGHQMLWSSVGSLYLPFFVG